MELQQMLLKESYLMSIVGNYPSIWRYILKKKKTKTHF